jgi:hypothetical protein
MFMLTQKISGTPPHHQLRAHVDEKKMPFIYTLVLPCAVMCRTESGGGRDVDILRCGVNTLLRPFEIS